MEDRVAYFALLTPRNLRDESRKPACVDATTCLVLLGKLEQEKYFWGMTWTFSNDGTGITGASDVYSVEGGRRIHALHCVAYYSIAHVEQKQLVT